MALAPASGFLDPPRSDPILLRRAVQSDRHKSVGIYVLELDDLVPAPSKLAPAAGLLGVLLDEALIKDREKPFFGFCSRHFDAISIRSQADHCLVVEIRPFLDINRAQELTAITELEMSSVQPNVVGPEFENNSKNKLRTEYSRRG